MVVEGSRDQSGNAGLDHLVDGGPSGWPPCVLGSSTHVLGLV